MHTRSARRSLKNSRKRRKVWKRKCPKSNCLLVRHYLKDRKKWETLRKGLCTLFTFIKKCRGTCTCPSLCMLPFFVSLCACCHFLKVPKQSIKCKKFGQYKYPLMIINLWLMFRIYMFKNIYNRLPIISNAQNG